MHPRSTRSRPLLRIKRKKVYTNNIFSPSRLLLPNIFNGSSSSDFVFADAVSCRKLKDIVDCAGIKLSPFLVEFWDERSAGFSPMLHASIHAPSNWSPEVFLQCFQKVSFNTDVVSLIQGNCIGGSEFPYITINMLHHHFKSK